MKKFLCLLSIALAFFASTDAKLFADTMGMDCIEFNCPPNGEKEVLLADPNDCHFYHRCTYFSDEPQSEIFMCGLGLYFEQTQSACVSPGTTGNRCFVKSAKHRCLLSLLLQKQSLATGEETVNPDDDDDEDVETPFSEVVSTTAAPTPPPMDDDGSGEDPIGYTCDQENSPCDGQPGRCNFHFPHVDSGMYVQCNEWGSQCFEMNCPAGLVWKDCTCNWP